MSGHAWTNEPQALFRGTGSPRAIEAVYSRGERIGQWTKHSVKEFLELYGTDVHVSANEFEPQEVPTPDEIVDSIINRYAKFKKIKTPEREDVIDNMRHAMENSGSSYEQQIDALRNYADMSYSTAKRAIMPFLKFVGVAKRPSSGQQQIYHGF